MPSFAYPPQSTRDTDFYDGKVPVACLGFQRHRFSGRLLSVTEIIALVEKTVKESREFRASIGYGGDLSNMSFASLETEKMTKEESRKRLAYEQECLDFANQCLGIVSVDSSASNAFSQEAKEALQSQPSPSKKRCIQRELADELSEAETDYGLEKNQALNSQLEKERKEKEQLKAQLKVCQRALTAARQTASQSRLQLRNKIVSFSQPYPLHPGFKP